MKEVQNILLTLLLVAGVLSGVYYFKVNNPRSGSSATVLENLGKNSNMILKTNFGDIELELFEKDAPATVANFLKLANSGFYNGTKFHRVIPGFMIQGGDPNSKDSDWSNDGMGGPEYQFKDELNPNTDSYKTGYVRGVLAMANSGPNTNGSQFFVMHKDYPLSHDYTIFGRVLSGMEAVDAIANLPKNQNDHPLKDAIILSVAPAVE